MCNNFTLEKYSVNDYCVVCWWQNDESAVERPSEVWVPNKILYSEDVKRWKEKGTLD